MAQIQADKVYKLVNVKAGTVLDLSGTDGTSITGWEDNNGNNQHWRLEPDNNQWLFRNEGNGRYLGFDGNPGDGVHLKGVDHRFKWDIWPDDHDRGVYRIFVPGSPVPINIDLSDNGNPKLGTPVTLWGKWEGTHQTWIFEEV